MSCTSGSQDKGGCRDTGPACPTARNECEASASSLLKWTCAFPRFGLTKRVLKLNLRHGGGGVGGLSTGKIRRVPYIFLVLHTKPSQFLGPTVEYWGVIWAHFIWLSSGFGETESSSVTQVGLQLTDTFLLYLPSAGPEAESEVWSTSPGFDRIGCLLTWATVISDFCFSTCAVDAMGELQGFGPTPH